MLDEGVDIPEIKRAIFCSSTEILGSIYKEEVGFKKPKLDGFEKDYAEVYMIVCPNEESYWDFLPYDKSQQMIKMEKYF